jgi:hypothetical protein
MYCTYLSSSQLPAFRRLTRDGFFNIELLLPPAFQDLKMSAFGALAFVGGYSCSCGCKHGRHSNCDG